MKRPEFLAVNTLDCTCYDGATFERCITSILVDYDNQSLKDRWSEVKSFIFFQEVKGCYRELDVKFPSEEFTLKLKE